jgi:antitoxin component YwqK of YwqJK toxin-antitoxin module
MKSKVLYSLGKKNGLEISWNKKAKPIYKANYKNGLLNGEVVFYQENKDLMKMKGNYEEDLRNGIFRVWSSSGSILFSANYELGELIKVNSGNLESSERILYQLEDNLY